MNNIINTKIRKSITKDSQDFLPDSRNNDNDIIFYDNNDIIHN